MADDPISFFNPNAAYLSFRLPSFASPHFNIALLVDMIKQRGVEICWQKSIACSCFDVNSGQPDPRCAQCYGYGFTYDLGTVSIALVTNRTWNTAQLPAPQGSYDTGVVNITFPPGCSPPPGLNDKVTVLKDQITVSGELLVRGDVAPNGDSLERVAYDEILSVERITTTRRVSLNPPDAVPYSTNIVDFYFGSDYVVNKNQIQWVGIAPTHAPSIGETYSIRYMARPQWIIFESLPLFRLDSHKDFLPIFVRAHRVNQFRRQTNTPPLPPP
jgi:hypothetical protein